MTLCEEKRRCTGTVAEDCMDRILTRERLVPHSQRSRAHAIDITVYMLYRKLWIHRSTD